ncbi:MAG: hypothetical protein GX589_08655 [Deltaproteobacteria bacterium]|nr:hypothetical protein [Deltaproteobacteria bacterium]
MNQTAAPTSITPQHQDTPQHTALSHEVSRHSISFEWGAFKSEMATERQRIAGDVRVMRVSLQQDALPFPNRLMVEFIQIGKGKVWTRGHFLSSEQGLHHFENLGSGNMQGGAHRSSKMLAWILIDAFIENGAQATWDQFLCGKPQKLPQQTPSEESTPFKARAVRKHARLKNGALVAVEEQPGEISLSITHGDGPWGDQLRFSWTCWDEEEITVVMLENFHAELCSEDELRQSTALEDLLQYVAMEAGQVSLKCGSRHTLSAVMHRKLGPALEPRLASWQKTPPKIDLRLALNFLHHGLEYHNLKRKNAEFDLFSDLALELSQLPCDGASRFVAKGPLGLELAFKIPPQDYLREWLKKVESFLRCFISKPETLLDRFESWLDPEHESQFPATSATINAFKHIAKLRRAEHFAAQKLGCPRLEATLEFKDGFYMLIYTSADPSITLTFKISENGIEALIVTEPSWPIPLKRFFSTKSMLFNHSRLVKIFSELFVALTLPDACTVQDSGLYQYLAENFAEETPPFQNTACRVNSLFKKFVTAHVWN